VVLLSPVSLPVFEQQERKGDSNSVDGDFTSTVDRVKALIACHVFSVAGGPVAGYLSLRDSWLDSRASTTTTDLLPWRQMKRKWIGRDYCCVGPKRTEKENKKKNVGVPYNMWVEKQRVILGCFRRSEERRRDIFSHFRKSVDSVEELYQTVQYSVQKCQILGNIYHPERD
jgi:hypothetical protein